MSTTLTTAMIFAAGRGERMRPLTDARPKPLLEAGGKPLIVWQIEALARAGIETIVINHAWLGEQFEATLGDGSRWGVRLAYSAEGDALETAGGIAQALPLLERDGRPTVFAGVAGDVYCTFDYGTLAAPAARMATLDVPTMHLVMVPNPPFHPDGDFVLRDDGLLALAGAPRVTFGSIGVYDTRMFHDIVPGTHRALSPYFRATIEAGRATGELYEGIWENVGTPAQLGELDARLRAAG
ncbi:nucleotidyl transferase family protein [Burkholderia ambifaria AMMD]|uniref:Nucleotidyl transferase n=1 Tax=Burkholderia ambifaria (strain ATCC BAA-244 / DSM 16087 / CCUG 44356 / LMG 19182 / AMMD) TaxID=339670 RepID=Q0BC02_BURCM|nr:nucleotidyltransferase family protein [Burkholderia ambifaria]ABI88321.1 Nucleotidyl transferase [Burkholderia ambifaria AMMD]AJY23307.1 nucleotidyl transferase family protein [Burkholderia ambifaria AMMD]MBR7931564.1 nucleotidyltransferase family protein [Burkholderia ambifaria]PEH64537.1 nucleotidyltransferase family protein [Burkholderia ambifaria]QQC04495.1 nucleotidyltransferase family protein [Burkholderia ambifaria]